MISLDTEIRSLEIGFVFAVRRLTAARDGSLAVVAFSAGGGRRIRHNNIPRTYRDTKPAAFDAGRVAKGKASGEVIEIIDRSTGQKLLILEDGRTG